MCVASSGVFIWGDADVQKQSNLGEEEGQEREGGRVSCKL